MKILLNDIGTGTQDILLYDSRLDLDNGYKLILPSPTMQVWRRIKLAAQSRQAVALSGPLMGGGPLCWAAEHHLAAGLKVYATPEAAATFDDDLDAVRAMGVTLLGEDEILRLPDDVVRVRCGDFDFQVLEQTFNRFGVTLSDLDAVAVSVFDHGRAPKGVSDRKFRFEYLDRTLRSGRGLSAFAHKAESIPPELTRMRAVAGCASQLACPLIVMDSAPAAILGATLDPAFSSRERSLVVNIGNGHTLACRLAPQGVEGFFEHHTGELDARRLEELLRKFAAGTLSNDEVYEGKGHGTLLYSDLILSLDHEDFNLLVTGPRQNMLKGSLLNPRFAAPFGDMMLTGCFGILAAVADLYPQWTDEIKASFAGVNGGHAPWDLLP